MGGLWFLLGKHHYLEDKVGNPLLRETKTAVILAYSYHAFKNGWISKVVFIKDVVHGFFGHCVDGLLHETWQTELEIHQVACKHHNLLSKALELQEVCLGILNLLAAFA